MNTLLYEISSYDPNSCARYRAKHTTTTATTTGGHHENLRLPEDMKCLIITKLTS